MVCQHHYSKSWQLVLHELAGFAIVMPTHHTCKLVSIVLSKNKLKYRKSSNKRPRRLLEHGAKRPKTPRRLLEHELQHPRRRLHVRPTMCKISSAFSYIGLTSFHCVVTPLGLFLPVCG